MTTITLSGGNYGGSIIETDVADGALVAVSDGSVWWAYRRAGAQAVFVGCSSTQPEGSTVVAVS